MNDTETNQNQQVAATSEPRGNAMEAFREQLVRVEQQFASVLPSTVSMAKFKAVLMSAVNQNPDLIFCDRRSFWSSSVKCAADGLVPDGREAVLLPFKSRVKRRDPVTGIDREIWVDLVTYIPMIAGVRKRMRNSGEVNSAVAEVVFRGDKFKYRLGDDAFIEHEPPPLDQDRGDAVGAYAVIRLSNGEVIREVMSFKEIERIRLSSKAKDGPAWKNHWGEMARKTVMKRASKSAPMSADLNRLMSREDEPAEIPDDAPHTVGDQDETRMLATGNGEPIPNDDRPVYEVTSCDGEVIGFRTIKTAEDALVIVAEEAGRQGIDILRGMLESNQAVIAQIHATDAGAANRIAAAFNEQRVRIEGTAQAQKTDAPQQQESRSASAAPVQQATVAQSEQTRGTPPPAGTAAESVSWFDNTQQGDLLLGVPQRGGKPDYRSWMVALFMPRLRQAVTADHITYLMGDNEKNLSDWRMQATEQQRREFDDLLLIEQRRVKR
jgi:phage RecT family recombinase